MNKIIRDSGVLLLSQEAAKELEHQQKLALEAELKTLDRSKDGKRISQISARLEAIERLSGDRSQWTI